MKRAVWLVASVVGLLWAGHQRAEACSCAAPQHWGFLMSSDGVIPKDSRGIVWAATDSIELTYHDFRIHTGEGEERTKVKVAVESIKLDSDTMFDRAWLVRPAEGFEPGKTYEIEYSGRGFVKQEDKKRTVTVSDEKLHFGKRDVRLVSVSSEHSDLTVARGASCSGSVKAHQIVLEAKLGKKVRDLHDYLSYEFAVDGKPWHPKSSLCQFLAPGRGWQDVGKELVYAACEGGGRGVPAGKHEVTVTVSAPGHKAKATASRKIVLRCN